VVEDKIYEFEGEQKNIMLYLYNWFTNEFNLLPKLKYKIPFYYKKSWICYTNPIKNEGVELAFIRGNELSNASNILQSKKRKQIKGIEIYQLKEAPFPQIQLVLQEAILLDETVAYKSPYTSKNKAQ